jgi:GT2 family glycosyltransferase
MGLENITKKIKKLFHLYCTKYIKQGYIFFGHLLGRVYEKGEKKDKKKPEKKSQVFQS